MFEDYLEDAHVFHLRGRGATAQTEAKRDYRAAVFYLYSALEAFVNYIGDMFATGQVLELYEIAFLTDKRFGISGGTFVIQDQLEFHRLEDKVHFLIAKFAPGFDFAQNPAWPRFLEFKRFRDDITHPRQEEDPVSPEDYKGKLDSGFSATIEIMNCISKGIFKRPLRRRILDLGG